MSPTSFILNIKNHEFISRMVSHENITKTEVINHALDLYRKYMLKKELVEGFSRQTDEDVREAMSDFNDYLSIVDSE